MREADPPKISHGIIMGKPLRALAIPAVNLSVEDIQSVKGFVERASMTTTGMKKADPNDLFRRLAAS